MYWEDDISLKISSCSWSVEMVIPIFISFGLYVLWNFLPRLLYPLGSTCPIQTAYIAFWSYWIWVCPPTWYFFLKLWGLFRHVLVRSTGLRCPQCCLGDIASLLCFVHAVAYSALSMQLLILARSFVLTQSTIFLYSAGGCLDLLHCMVFEESHVPVICREVGLAWFCSCIDVVQPVWEVVATGWLVPLVTVASSVTMIVWHKNATGLSLT